MRNSKMTVPYTSRHVRIVVAGALLVLHGAMLCLLERAYSPVPEGKPVVYTDLIFITSPSPRTQMFTQANTPSQPARGKPRAPMILSEPIPARMSSADANVVSMPLPTSAQSTKAASNSVAEFDLDAIRALARENERQRKREPLEIVQDSQRIYSTDESKLAQDIKKAGRLDCLKAYSGGTKLDFLRLIPLAIDTVTNTGCKW